jgi:ribosomal protein S12 methylthiotransferase accessory factor
VSAVAVSAAEGLTRARRIVSPRTGIVSGVTFHDLAADDPLFYWATSHPGSTVPIGGLAARNEGNAASVDRDRAVLKAVGESVERYCAALYDERDLLLATHDELEGDAVPPENFVLFSERQYREPGFRFAPFTRETPVRWARGRSLVHDRPTWVAAQFVYVPDRGEPSREPPLRGLISTGLAAGPTLAHAAYRGMVEMIERDAFSIVWHHRLPRPHIDLESVRDPFVERLLRAFRGVPVRLHAVLLTLDVDVPVVLVVMTSESGRPPLTTIGVGADLSPRRALALALEEAGLGFIAVRWLAANTPDYRPEPGYRDCVDLRRHALAHALDPALQSRIDFLIRPSETLSLGELPDRSSASAAENLRVVARELGDNGFDVVAVDLTTPDIDAVGYKVVRSVVPGLQPLDDDHTCRHLGGHRLSAEGDLNPDPHPFP